VNGKCNGGGLDPTCLAVAIEAFRSAAAGEINPSELARALRELFGDCGGEGEVDLCRDIKEFLDLDLSDYAYSLAISDQHALDELKQNIKTWAERLAQKMAKGKA